MLKNSSNSSTEGVILDPSSSSDLLKKQISPSKKWVFTYNNYNSSIRSELNELFTEICEKFMFQEEKGENGTPHLQGFCIFKNKIRPLSLKLDKSIHWEKMKGTVEQSIAYCSKSQTKKWRIVYKHKTKS